MPIEDRVCVVAPRINDLIAQLENGELKQGVQVVQQYLLQVLLHSGLSDDRWIDVEKVGVHPDNREKAGLVPIDVHDLLLCIVKMGWSWVECAAMGLWPLRSLLTRKATAGGWST